MKLKILFFIILSILNGCSSTGTKIINHANTNKTPTITELNLKNAKNISVQMDSLGYDSSQLSQSMHQSSMNASMQSGVNPAAGAAGALIGGLIVQSTTQSSAQKQKNEPVSTLLETIKSTHLEPIFAKCFTLSENKNPAKKHENLLTLSPTIKISPDYRSLLLEVTASISDKGKIIYQNIYHIQSKPLLRTDQNLPDLNQLSPTETEAILFNMVEKIPTILAIDIGPNGNINSSTATSIRFNNAFGDYFERGFLIEKFDDYVLFKSLRGEMKFYPANKML